LPQGLREDWGEGKISLAQDSIYPARLSMVTSVLATLLLAAASSSSSLPLHEAAANGDAAKVQQLIAGGADINELDQNGKSPLSLSARHLVLPLVRLLLDRGADPNLADEHGNTPLHTAADSRGYRQSDVQAVLALLVARGARADLLNHDQESPADVALRAGFPASTRWLMAKGAPIDKANVLRNAVGTNWTEAIALALEIESNPAELTSALCLAANNGCLPCVKLLVEHGADPAGPCKGAVSHWPSPAFSHRPDSTPLHEAASSYHPDPHLFWYLLDHGADVNAPNNGGETPFTLTLSRASDDEKHREILWRMRRRGAIEHDPTVVNMGLSATVGGAISMHNDLRLDLTLRPEVLVHKRYPRFGYGGYVEVGTRYFHDLLLGGGLDGMVATSRKSNAHLSPSLGGYVHKAADWSAGLSASLFWGTRFTWYTADDTWTSAVGLRLTGRLALNGERDHSVVLAFEADPLLLLGLLVLAKT
jgi:ankyrin repeat protein